MIPVPIPCPAPKTAPNLPDTRSDFYEEDAGPQVIPPNSPDFKRLRGVHVNPHTYKLDIAIGDFWATGLDTNLPAWWVKIMADFRAPSWATEVRRLQGCDVVACQPLKLDEDGMDELLVFGSKWHAEMEVTACSLFPGKRLAVFLKPSYVTYSKLLTQPPANHWQNKRFHF